MQAMFLLLGYIATVFCQPAHITNLNTGLTYQSIQSAIDAPQTLDGHTLLVSTGTFTENVTINKSITIRGAGRDSTILQAADSNKHVISIAANNVSIKGLTVKNGTGLGGIAGILLNNTTGILVDSCKITNNFRGILLKSSSDNIISNCNVVSNIENGLLLLSSSNRNQIIKNVVANTLGGVGDWTGNGINTGDQSSSLTIIEENTIYDNALAGIIGYAGSNNTLIRRNIIFSNQGAGIQFGWSSGCIFEDNNIYNNHDGIVFDTAPNNICRRNKIINNTESGISMGGLGQTNILIDSNLISKGTYGILIGSKTRNSIIKQNTISSCSTGIYISQNPNYENYGNRIYNNNFYSNIIHAKDNSPEVDYWDNGLPEGGNYWDNWISPDLNNDGFVDNPFLIDGGYSQDNYPLVKPYGEQTIDTLQFSDQLQLSSDGYRPDIAFDQKSSSIYVVYEGWRDIYPEIFITKSEDNGKTFSSPIPITKQTAGIIERPAIGIDTSGNIHIVYNDAGGYLAYCKSTDGGNTFSVPLRISDAPSSGIDRSRLTCFGNNVYVVWRYDENDYRIYLDKSINGLPFGTDVQINDITTGTRGKPSIAIDANETIYVTWLDRDKIRLAKSSNQGASFTSSVRVDDNEGVFPCNRPSITTIGIDTIFVVWEDSRDAISQIRYSKSINGGYSFETSKNVADSTGDFEQLYPKIVKDNNNVIHAIWQDSRYAADNSDIFYAYLPNGENSFSKNLKVNSAAGKTNYGHKYPALAVGNEMIFTTWQGSAEGVSGWQIYFSKAKFIMQPPTFVQEDQQIIPYNFVLYQNYPNPFNPETKIEYSLHSNFHVILKVYNILGEEIATLIDQEQPAGNYVVEFQSKNLSSGVYFYRLQVGNYSTVKKMIIVR